MSFPKNHLFPDPDQQLSKIGRALGHPARIYILKYLKEHGPKRFEELVKSVPLTEGTVGAHLKKLRVQGLVDVEEHGLVNIYTLNQAGVEEMFAHQLDLYSALKEETSIGQIGKNHGQPNGLSESDRDVEAQIGG